MQKKSYLQLSALTFFQYFVAGATSPMLGSYLKDTLGFSGAQIGVLLTLFQAATMTAPLAAAFLADRLVPSRSLYALLNLIGAGFSLLLTSQTEFWPVLILLVTYAFFLGPTGGLVNALIFAGTPDGQGQYGLVRLWGTVGWVAVAGLLALLWLAPGASVSWMFWVGAGGNVAAAAAALLLPQRGGPVPGNRSGCSHGKPSRCSPGPPSSRSGPWPSWEVCSTGSIASPPPPTLSSWASATVL